VSSVLKRSKRSPCLDAAIECDEDLKSRLTADTVVAVNKVAKELKVDDPGLVVQILDYNRLHTAMGLPSSPVPQGLTPEQSANAFRNWLIASSQLVPGITPAHQVPTGTTSTAFRHLTETEANDIVYGNWHNIPWAFAIQAAGLVGNVALVLWLSGAGRGKAHMFEARQVFG
jgi:hypothetical protein